MNEMASRYFITFLNVRIQVSFGVLAEWYGERRQKTARRITSSIQFPIFLSSIFLSSIFLSSIFLSDHISPLAHLTDQIGFDYRLFKRRGQKISLSISDFAHNRIIAKADLRV